MAAHAVSRPGWPQLMVGLLALALLVHAGWQLLQLRSGVTIQTTHVGSMPVTVFRPAAASAGASAAASVVVVAHGFAGSQQLMQPLALSLARNGFTAVTFDFPGHGRNPQPMTGGLADQQRSLRTLLEALDSLSGWVGTQSAPGAGYAVLGHSMASDIVVRHAQAHPQVWATVALSLFAPSITADTPPDQPRNLLVVDGEWEPGMLHREAQRVVGLNAGSAGSAVQTGRTYGSFADGTARRAALAGGVEHIAVLYSADSAREAVAWLQQARGQVPTPVLFTAAYGPHLAALLAGLLGLGWALAAWLPRVAEPQTHAPAPWRWRRFWPLAVLPVLGTPLLLWKVPTDMLPILLGDYLVLHFGVYGLFTALLMAWRGGPALPRARWAPLALAALAVAVWGLLAVGWPLDQFLFNLRPDAVRWPVIAALLAGTLPWFLADEALTRSARAPRAAYLVTKLCFLLSLVVAIALNPGRLFFLALIVPAILMLFIVFGLFSRWVQQRCGHPWVAAVANAVVFAWFMALTFPLVD